MSELLIDDQKCAQLNNFPRVGNDIRILKEEKRIQLNAKLLQAAKRFPPSRKKPGLLVIN